MDIQAFYDKLKQLHEKKGFYFNKDKDVVFDLLQALLTNRDRYGYMCCPCRIACGEREYDQDIICPCDYRAPDVEEFGSCFCKLYVSPEWNEGKIHHDFIPERRSQEKIDKALEIFLDEE
ncbi:MAG: ferredoxin:thioredoxin reductase [Proteobacteria bacterium]|nr:ferredoxin:thioredoxin reductase [Pseudomonadota bacterium]